MNKTLSILLATTVFFSACKKQLNIYPHSAASSTNLSPEDLELFLNGVYNKVQNAPGRESYIMFDLIGGNLVNARGTGGTLPLTNSILRPEQSLISAAWEGYFKGLYQTNVLLQSTSSMADTHRKQQILGIAHFFRGYIYYNLITRWGAVPILKENTIKKVSRDPEAKVWAFIESELKEAIKFAPDYSDYFYVSKEAARALMARVALAQGKYKEASNFAESVIRSTHFKLDSFDKLFRNVQNTEEIFAFKNLTEESAIAISTLFYTYDQPEKGSYVYAPAADVLQLYNDNDKRKAISINFSGSDPIINKYPSGQKGTDPIIVLRLGEMYLISAESQGIDGINRLNQLRNYRGLADLHPSTQSDYLEMVLLERRRELLAEGFRWYDLVRLQKAREVLGIKKSQLKLPLPESELVLNDLLEQNPDYGN